MLPVTPSGEDEASAIVVVLFHPDAQCIEHIQTQAAAGHQVIAVSNGITAAQRELLAGMSGVALIDNNANVGLAKALNQGIELFLSKPASHVMLLDQDSRVPPDTIALLIKRAKNLRAEGVAVACVAPTLVDKKAPEASVGAQGEPLTVATSGSLLSRDAILHVGQMWEELFIDGIDHEWCFRARAAGFLIVIDRQAKLVHHMGDAGIRIGNRFRPIHRSPFRHYHIVRNTLWLQRCRHIPLRWRAKELVKLGYRAPIYLLVSSDRSATFRALVRAVADGVAGPKHVPQIPVVSA